MTKKTEWYGKRVSDKGKKWKPKPGEKCYYILVDNKYYYYRTKREAQAALKRVKKGAEKRITTNKQKEDYMALETLKGVERIGDFQVVRTDQGDFGTSIEDGWTPIIIDDDTNSIGFQIQNGPIKEVGINGCQVDTIIETAKIMLEGLNKNFPCRENALAITKLEEALHWLDARKKNREKRGVEGLSKA